MNKKQADILGAVQVILHQSGAAATTKGRCRYVSDAGTIKRLKQVGDKFSLSTIGWTILRTNSQDQQPPPNSLRSSAAILQVQEVDEQPPSKLFQVFFIGKSATAEEPDSSVRPSSWASIGSTAAARSGCFLNLA